MGFLTGVVTGVALAAGAAAWYLSRSGERARDQYRVEDRLAEVGDALERRTRDIRAQVSDRLAEMRTMDDPAGARSDGTNGGAGLDGVRAAAAEAAAEAEAREAAAPAGPRDPGNGTAPG
jgi:hypothetical protein